MSDRTIAEMRALLERCHEAFAYMPHLHGAVSDSTVDEVRAEVNEAVDWYWSDLEQMLGRGAVDSRSPVGGVVDDGTTTDGGSQ